MTNTFEPLREGDTVTAEFSIDTPRGRNVAVTGKVARIHPDGAAVWLEADDGYYPLRAGVVIEHIPQQYAD